MTVGLVQAEEDLAALLEHVGSDRRPAARAEMAHSADTRAFLEIDVELLVGDLLQHPRTSSPTCSAWTSSGRTCRRCGPRWPVSSPVRAWAGSST